MVYIAEEMWKKELRTDELGEYVKYLDTGKELKDVPANRRGAYKKWEGSSRVEAGLLYYRTQIRIVVPYQSRERVLHAFHRRPESGHRGFRKTMAALAKCYYWPGMAKDVKRYVNQASQDIKVD